MAQFPEECQAQPKQDVGEDRVFAIAGGGRKDKGIEFDGRRLIAALLGGRPYTSSPIGLHANQLMAIAHAGQE